MNRDQFMALLNKPEIPDSTISGQLYDVLMSYPYCQAARLLYVKSLTDQHSILYNDQLKIVSAYATDRSRLYELMNRAVQEDKSEIIDEIMNDDNLINEEQKDSDISVNEGETMQQTNALFSTELDVSANELKEDVNSGRENSETENKKVEEKISEIELPPEDAKLNPVEIATELVSTKQETELHAKPKHDELSPQEIIKQRLAELNKVEKQNEMEEKKDAEISSSLQIAETKVVQPISDAEREEKIHIETEHNEHIPKEPNPLLPEIIESTVVGEEHVEIEEPEHSVNADNNKEMSSIENEFIESSFTQDVNFNYESSTVKTDLQNEIPGPSSEDEAEKNSDEINPALTGNKEHSFLSWLKAVDTDSIVELQKVEPVKVEERDSSELAEKTQKHKLNESVSDNKSESTSELINKFIDQDPKIEPGKAQFYSAGNMAKNSIVDDGNLASETLANIYLEQGNHQKAINMLELLSLKNPKKSAYFASRIKEIKSSNK